MTNQSTLLSPCFLLAILKQSRWLGVKSRRCSGQGRLCYAMVRALRNNRCALAGSALCNAQSRAVQGRLRSAPTATPSRMRVNKITEHQGV